MEKCYIGKTGEQYYLRVESIGVDGKKYIKHTSNPITIKLFLKKHNAIIDGKAEGRKLILRTNKTEENPEMMIQIDDFPTLENDALFQDFWKSIDKTPFVPKNIVDGNHTNLFQAMGLKLLYFNRKKIAGILAASFIITGAPGVIIDNIIDQYHQQADKAILNRASENRVYEIQSIEKQLDFDERILQTMGLKSNYDEYNPSRIMLGARVDIVKMNEIFTSEKGKVIFEQALNYGVDPYMLMAKGFAESGLMHEECCPGGEYYNGYAVGAFQLESPNNSVLKAFNYKTGEEESIILSMSNAIVFEKNVQAAAMREQLTLERYNGNPYLALQSYNYGPAMMDVVIYDYAEKTGKTEEEVKNDINDLGWLSIVNDIHRNPNKYYYRAVIGPDEKHPDKVAQAQIDYVWKQATYGNPNYVSNVLSYYVGILSQNQKLNGTSTVINLCTNEQMDLTSVETNKTSEKFMM